VWNTKAHYLFYKNSPLDPILSQINPIHALTPCFVMMQLLILASAPPSLRQCPFFSVSDQPPYPYNYAERVYYDPACSQTFPSLFFRIWIDKLLFRKFSLCWWTTALGLPVRPTPLLSQMGKVRPVTLQHRTSMYVCDKPLFRFGLLFLVSLSSEKTRKFISVPERSLGFEYLFRKSKH
jgi:hypothetical protein